jgi:hypothetical protein
MAAMQFGFSTLNAYLQARWVSRPLLVLTQTGVESYGRLGVKSSVLAYWVVANCGDEAVLFTL